MEPPTNRSSTRRLIAATLSCVGLVCLSIAFVDRPAATWSHDHLRGIALFPWLTYLVDPLLPAAVVVFAVAGLALARGWKLPGWFLTLLAAGLATVIAVVIKDQLKWTFGRPWPETWTHNNPSWIGTGTYGFFPFHGGQGWASFPSGHMTRITAFMTVLWLRIPRYRWLWATFIVLVAAGLYGADYHFVGDMIAGTYLGVACAVGVHTWMFCRR